MSLKFLALGKIKLVTRHKKLIVYALQSIFHQYFILLCAQDNSNRRIVVRLANLIFEIIQIEIHLANVTVLDFCTFQINQDITFQNGVIEYHIHFEAFASYRYDVLTSHEGETSAQLQQELFHVGFQSVLQFRFLVPFSLWYAGELQNVWVANDISRLLNLMSFICKTKNTFFVRAERKSMEQR